MSQPKLILISDDQAFIDIGEERVSSEEVDMLQKVLAAAMKDKTPIVLAGEMGWDIVDKRQPDIEKRLERVERWIDYEDRKRRKQYGIEEPRSDD